MSIQKNSSDELNLSEVSKDKRWNDLFHESERGSIVIGASIIEEYLQKRLEVELPESSNTYRKKLFSYPNVLSSFGSKIEMAYAFRVIQKPLYQTLDSLRKLRNSCAHDIGKFGYEEFEEEIKNLLKIGDKNLMQFLANIGFKAFAEMKLSEFDKGLKELGLSDNERYEELIKLSEDKDLVHKYERFSYKLGFIYSLMLIAAMIKSSPN